MTTENKTLVQVTCSLLWQHKLWWLVPMISLIGFGLALLLLGEPITERPFVYTIF